jgi:PAS domain S-box-containing protein
LLDDFDRPQTTGISSDEQIGDGMDNGGQVVTTGVSEPGEGESSEWRELDADERDEHARQRDENADERDVDGDQRDADGEQRDIDGDQRDQSADQRDLEGLRRDAVAEERDERERVSEVLDLTGTGTSTGADTEAVRVSSVRRAHAAADRRGAMRDRDQAALERGEARLDRGAALANRVAGASGRQSAGTDRDTASNDRAASATDRHIAQMEERFRELANNVDAGFVLRVIDPPEFLYLNPAYFTIFGFDPDGPPPTPAESLLLVHPDDRVRVSSIIADTAAGWPVEQEFRFRGPAGTQRWVSERVSPIVDDDGLVRRVAGVFTDITDRKASDAALRNSEERLDQLARSTEVGFFVREQSRMLYMNSGLFRILALDPDKPNPTMPGIMSMIHPADRELSATATAGADRDESTQVELRIIRPDGEIRWIRQTNDPVTTVHGDPIRVAGTVTDITERKVAEEITRIAQLDARAAQLEARAAQLDAERANTSKDEFLSKISHELRTPLNAVIGFTQLLELDELTPAQDDAVGHILRGGRHLLSMINDVLDISVIESDRIDLALEPVSICDLVRDTIGLMGPLAAARGIDIELDCGSAGGIAFVLADRRRVKQVLLNLLSNAIKYNRQNGRIDISLTTVDGNSIGVAITDTGLGINTEDLPRLFNPFDRLDQPSDIEGTGLGLALSLRLTRLMNGNLQVRSTPGTGSTFLMTLPVTDPPQATAPTENRPGKVPAPTSPSTVLYIEDNSSNIDLIAGILRRRLNWTMSEARTGRQGLELANTTAPTVILLDQHLPDTHGLEVIKALRSNPRTSAIPVAVLSADTTHADISRSLLAGAQEYFTKPIDVTQILAFLDAHAHPRKSE